MEYGKSIKAGKPNQQAAKNDLEIDQNFISRLPAALFTCDVDGTLTYYNDAAVDLWGRTPDLEKDRWCGSWKIYDLEGNRIPMEDCPMALLIKNEQKERSEEIVIELPDGSKRNVLMHPRLIRDSDNKVIGGTNILIDISELSDKEKELKESEYGYKLISEMLEEKNEERTRHLKLSEERYHKMIEEVQDYAILLLDKDGTIMNWNQGAEKIKGYKQEEIIGQNFRVFYLDEDRKSKLPEKLINEASTNGRAMHEGWRRKKDGSKFWGSIVITALHNDENDVIGFSKVTRDLTERKFSEDKMKQYALDIELRNKQLEEYAYIASHDLQEPLRKIRIFSELLEKNLDNHESATKYLSKINSSAVRMTNLIQDVLKYSQLEEEDKPVPVDLNEMLKNSLEDYELLIKEKKAKIFASELPEVQGIPIQIQQLFGNLIGNSLKFCEENPEIRIGYKLATKAEVEEQPQLFPYETYHRLTFEDNGVGFEPAYQEKIFQLFKRLNNHEKGTGIGLALCKRIVENHRGAITVDSQPGEGAKFTIYLPV